ncbi:MAG: glycosyltransferase family 4 protein [Candidatus Saccharibacteria bacterium]|nr:glycosyltransferase family 4 protein [Microbacteriaceae bacterium]
MTFTNARSRAVRRRVLVISGDPIGVKLAGPAIRAWSIAEALTAKHEVTLMSLTLVEDIPAPFALVSVREGDDHAFSAWERWADVIIFQGHAMEFFEALQTTKKIVVADIYDPMHLEQLEQAREFPADVWDERVMIGTVVLNQQLERADFFLCASDRQRLFFLGQLAALGRINPANYADDPDLTGLICVVPFGLSRTAPVHERDVLKGQRDGIAADDKLLLWSGGLYNWFDPKTLISAVSLLSSTRHNIRLFFQGTQHPHPGVPEMAIVSQSRALAASLGALETTVFFNDSWVDYADRQNYLTEADVGVSTHRAHIETTMSFRTRILDYLWAGLPMVVTEGDVFAELIADESLGIAVPADAPELLAAALERALFDQEFIAQCRANIARVRERFYWDRVLRPLVDFVDDAHHAPDIALGRVLPVNRMPVRPSAASSGGRIRRNLRALAFYLRTGGIRAVAARVAVRLRRRGSAFWRRRRP